MTNAGPAGLRQGDQALGLVRQRGGGPYSELYIPKTVEISASQMRQFLVRDDRESWERYVNPKMHALYPELRALVLASQGNKDTMSV